MCACVCVCVCTQSCTNSTRSGQVANGNLQSDKRCHDKQKAEPYKSGRVCRQGNSQKQRKGQRGSERKNKERKKDTHKDKLKGRNDMENTKIQEAHYFSQLLSLPNCIHV